MTTRVEIPNLKTLRPLLLLGLFMLVWSGRGYMEQLAQTASAQAASLAAECAEAST